MQEEIKKYFFKYNQVCKKLFQTQIELENYNSNMGTVGSRGFSEVSTNSHNNNGLENKILQQEKIQNKIIALCNKKEKLRNKHIQDFKELSKDDYETILTCYYLDKLNIKDISIKLDKSIGHIKKLKRMALKELIGMIKK